MIFGIFIGFVAAYLVSGGLMALILTLDLIDKTPMEKAESQP